MIATHSAPGHPALPLVSQASTSYSECLSFQLGSVSYAIDILKVQEIRAYETPTRMVNAPACVKGVLNLRGVIVPVVDLRIKLGLPQADFNTSTVTVVLSLSQGVVGAVVDSVSDVLDLSPSQIKPAPHFDSVMPAHCITGIASVPQGDTERLLMLLDIDSVLSLHAHPAGSAVLQ
jgi:purine-binding chemotaxis protein CheW